MKAAKKGFLGASERFKEETTAFTSNQRRHILVLIPAHVKPMKFYNIRIKDFDLVERSNTSCPKG